MGHFRIPHPCRGLERCWRIFAKQFNLNKFKNVSLGSFLHFTITTNCTFAFWKIDPPYSTPPYRQHDQIRNALRMAVEGCQAGGQGQVLASTCSAEIPKQDSKKVQLSRKTKHFAHLGIHGGKGWLFVDLTKGNFFVLDDFNRWNLRTTVKYLCPRSEHCWGGRGHSWFLKAFWHQMLLN